MHENTQKTKTSTGSYYGQNNSMYTADMLVKDQKKTGQVGHDGSDGLGSVDIIKRTGFKGTKMGRILPDSTSTAIDIVTDFMIDDGVPDRCHRNAFLGS